MTAPHTHGPAAPRADGERSKRPSPKHSSPDRPGPKRACSQRKLEANRANAKKSTGPRTPEGKARSRLNGLVHGLCASLAVLPGEDPGVLRRFAASLYADLRPRGPAEAVLVDQYVSIAWKLRRLGSVEGRLTGFHLGNDLSEFIKERDAYAWAADKPGFKEMAERYGPPPEPDPQPAAEWLLAEFQKGSGIMLRLMDLEIRLRATLQSTLRQLKDLRALRRRQEEEERDADERAWEPGEWDDDTSRWGAEVEGEEEEEDAPGDCAPVDASPEEPPARTEATAPAQETAPQVEPQVEAGSTDAVTERADGVREAEGLGMPGEATQATAVEGCGADDGGGTGGPAVQPLRAGEGPPA